MRLQAAFQAASQTAQCRSFGWSDRPASTLRPQGRPLAGDRPPCFSPCAVALCSPRRGTRAPDLSRQGFERGRRDAPGRPIPYRGAKPFAAFCQPRRSLGHGRNVVAQRLRFRAGNGADRGKTPLHRRADKLFCALFLPVLIEHFRQIIQRSDLPRPDLVGRG